jgi:hypothetical protein
LAHRPFFVPNRAPAVQAVRRPIGALTAQKRKQNQEAAKPKLDRGGAWSTEAGGFERAQFLVSGRRALPLSGDLERMAEEMWDEALRVWARRS